MSVICKVPSRKQSFLEKLSNKLMKFSVVNSALNLYKSIRYRNPESVVDKKHDLKRIDFSNVTAGNKAGVVEIADNFCRIDSMGMKTYVLKHKKNGITMIYKGEFKDVLTKYGQDYMLIENPLRNIESEQNCNCW